ncbi:protease inhibitor I42 family protein (plasmid) [Bacillus sp. N447-1]|uniref:protease inhibitor I42 family protein n=1 Tax=Bacillus sp. N447-1 TaxID=2789208 RepID=UPI001F60E2AB|nr:protease inhibitor I42 family protein [Bacillus sp. N447-1]UNT71659.1 protease inhibitor I42 family protein [Bacillus sp. N447-1]
MKIKKPMIIAGCLAGCLVVGVSLMGSTSASDASSVKPADSSKEIHSNKPTQKDDHMKELEVTVGKTFDITLGENLSTGYSWSYTTNTDRIQLVTENIKDPKESDAVGEPTKKTWTFKATKAGTYTLKFDYSHRLEKGQKPTQSLTYTVKVK